MSATPSRRRKTADPPARRSVKCTVVLDVATHARLAAAAALAGCDRSTLAARYITEGLRTAGVVVLTRRGNSEQADPSDEGKSADAA